MLGPAILRRTLPPAEVTERPRKGEAGCPIAPPHLDATMAEARIRWAVKQRFVERLKKVLPEAGDPAPTTVPQQVHVIEVRRPSFLRQGGCLVQVKAQYPEKTLVFWCLFFDGETDAVVEPFLDQETSIPDVIERVEKKRGLWVLAGLLQQYHKGLAQIARGGPQTTGLILKKGRTAATELIRIDSKTIRDYVVEFINYELAGGAEAGLLVNDLDPNSRTFGVLDWPTPILKTEIAKVRAGFPEHRISVSPDTDYSLRVEACMVERDALVWREFRVFTKDNSSSAVDPGQKGLVKPTERPLQVLVTDLPDNCRAKPGASLGVPEVRFAPDSDGWQSILDADACRRLVRPFGPSPAHQSEARPTAIRPLESPASGVLRSRFVEN